MIMFSIAEWVANILVLGMGIFFWASSVAIFIITMSVFIERITNE
tara:strand:- start:1557 stop:1691 length:135 start_codon:yes stop_codon:yes gene_type:complete